MKLETNQRMGEGEESLMEKQWMDKPKIQIKVERVTKKLKRKMGIGAKKKEFGWKK